MSEEVVVIEEQQKIANVPANKMEQLQLLIDSKALPSNIKTIEQAFTIDTFGKELGMKTMQSFHQIYSIQGRLCLSSKALGALLWKNGISYRTIKDGETYVRGINAEGKEIKDKITTIEFTRGNIVELSSFCWSDAVLAGWTTKDNWVKLPKHMLYARALALGANRIAPDIILGLYTVEEMVDVTNDKNTIITEDGEVKIIS